MNMLKRGASESPLCLEPIANKLCHCVSHVGNIDVVLDARHSGTSIRYEAHTLT